ncbi:MAG: protein phosphatase 2C domain-containing protein [Nocardioides sp.]|uniref:PP2C family protein-serine/threonine phosphatase n=1 Tax=Nocardioides sp. TaxID=35761 RepID=UPI0039E67CBB
MTQEPESPETRPDLRLSYAATSDVGRVRKDNQDSGYAGPWLLVVCDGVGGAARGDIASSTAVQQLRKLDRRPDPELDSGDLVGVVSHGLHMAHDRIGELVDHDPSLDGTSTTATVGLFDGHRIAVGHVGDSRAYLFRDGELTLITHDHTFVQTLIDEGRITEDEAKTHPHRNLILRALDGRRELEPDLLVLDLQPGDRLMFCSDGVSGVLADARMADVLGTGSPDFAAVELVRVALEAGSSDNVTCLVADVLPAGAAGGPAAAVEPSTDTRPTPIPGHPTGVTTVPSDEADGILVGAAAELRRKLPSMTGLFRGHRMGDTGELEPITDDDVPADAITADPEELRYALRPPRRFVWLRRIFALVAVIGVLWVAAAAGWAWTQQQWFVGEKDGKVAIYRGVHTTLLGLDLYDVYQTSDLDLSDLADVYQSQVSDGLHQDSLAAARRKVQELADDSAAEDSP